MNAYVDCVPCMVRQAVDAVRLVRDDDDTHCAVLRDVLSALRDEVDFGKPAPLMAQRVHRIIRSHLGDADPYRQTKQRSNAQALGIYPTLKTRVAQSADPFETAVRLSIAGNIIDYGVDIRLDSEMLNRTISDAMSAEISYEELECLKESIEESESILYLADNAGEIVFDKLLIGQMPRHKVTVAVRGAPVINDATLEDAQAVGLTDLVHVIDNGTDIPGTVPEECSAEFNRVFESADLVIAKGQGNLETLCGLSKRICFLLLTKCPLIARELGCDVGTMVIHNTQHVCSRRLPSAEAADVGISERR